MRSHVPLRTPSTDSPPLTSLWRHQRTSSQHHFQGQNHSRLAGDPQPNAFYQSPPGTHRATVAQVGQDFTQVKVSAGRGERAEVTAQGIASQSSGRPLPRVVRQQAEQRLGCPLGQVQLHDDVRGGWTALSVGARAVTVGNHIYLAPGESTWGDRALLLHELTHVATQDPALGIQSGIAARTHPAEQVAASAAIGHRSVLPKVPLGTYRSPMLRTDFERQMRRFGVRRIFTSTFEEQRDRLNYFGAGTRPGDRLSASAWTAWSPGDDSPVYDWIVAAFTRLAQQFGGVPHVEEIGFYATDYTLDSSGQTLIADSNTAASYGGGKMAIYQSAVTQATSFTVPSGRSTGSTAAATAAMTQEQGVVQTVTHELGHGLVETALTPRGSGSPAPIPALMNDYRRAVGWTAGSSPELFDAGIPAVRSALANGQTPPTTYRINRSNWNAPRWIEQPLSSYMTTHPSEDFPEAIAYYMNSPDILRQRSPRRFAFIESHRAALSPYLQRDLATVRLFPTEAELRQIIEQSSPPPWLSPSPPAPTTPGRRVPNLLEIRF